MKANQSLIRIITSAVESARSHGRDYVAATERAVRAVRSVEPDLTDRAARRLVEVLRAD